MAIAIKLINSETNLFCASKWWGDPDMQEDMEYPLHEDYPMTFICQLNCEYLENLDPEGLLPHSGMLYFFGAIDHLIGYESPVEYGKGEWPRSAVRVKYAKDINFETFRTCEMQDENGDNVAEKALEISLEKCDDDDAGLRFLGNLPSDLAASYPEHQNLLQISFGDEDGMKLNIIIKKSDLSFGNWKKAFAVLH